MQVYSITLVFICLTAQRPSAAILLVTKHTGTTVQTMKTISKILDCRTLKKCNLLHQLVSNLIQDMNKSAHSYNLPVSLFSYM